MCFKMLREGSDWTFVYAYLCAPARAFLRRDEINIQVAELWETRKWVRNKTPHLIFFLIFSNSSFASAET